jgi:hypothetical protein
MTNRYMLQLLKHLMRVLFVWMSGVSSGVSKSLWDRRLAVRRGIMYTPSLTVGEKKNPEKCCTARLFGVHFIKKVLYGIIISKIFLSADSVP